MNEKMPPLIKPSKERSWWDRNLKWVLPSGCLVTILVFALLIVLIVSFVMGLMKSSDVYKHAIAKAMDNPAVEEALGSPLEEGFFVTGNINVTGVSGEANVAIPISGPKAKGTIYLKAEKIAGKWDYSMLVVHVKDTDEQINLLEYDSTQDHQT